jgi:hypothetical protein
MFKKILFYSLLIIALLITSVLFLPYLISPVYHFYEPKVFSGQMYYNPYQQLDTAWKVCNFHTHSKSWGGFTDGKSIHTDSIFEIYKKMGYSYLGISNYQKITHINSSLFGEVAIFIPAYEHGFNIKKRHHLCLGAKKVSWLDFVFFQTLSHKQFVLNKLKSSSDFVTINHPRFFNSFEESDLCYLSNYDAIEVLSQYRRSITHWDSALSSGYYAVLLANDDMHRLDKMDEIGANFTVINSNSFSQSEILQTLKVGRHIGVKANLKENEDYTIKTERIAHLTYPVKIEMKGDTLAIQLEAMASVIRFIGQGGEIKENVFWTNSAQYIFCQTDTYIRIEWVDMEGNSYLANPIVRTDDSAIVNIYRAEIDSFKTNCKRIVIVTVLLLIVFGVYRRKRKILH